jgi:hypothetical protein
MKLSSGTKIVLTLLVLAALLGFAGTPYFCIPAANSAYFALTLVGIVVICLSIPFRGLPGFPHSVLAVYW